MSMPEQSTDHPLLLRLQQYLTSCSNAVVDGDFNKSEGIIVELVSFLDSIVEAVASNPDDEDAIINARQVLSEIHSYICSPSVNQGVIDALSFELPKAASKFAGVSDSFCDIADGIIDRFIVTCNPRDMLPIICEAIDSSSEMTQTFAYYSPLLSGFSKVVLSIQRRHFEQLKVAIPVILKVLKTMSSESENEDMYFEYMFDKAISIANSVHAVCLELDEVVCKKVRALLGLYVLQIMTLVSISIGDDISRCIPLVIRLTRFFQYCGLSYLGLITGSDVDSITSVVIEDDDYMKSISYVRHGASLSVIWGYVSDEVAQAAEEDLFTVKNELKSKQTERWQSVGMLKYIFSTVNLPWKLKKHAVDLLLCITEENNTDKCDDEQLDFSSYMPSLFAALQAIAMVIMYSSDAMLRKNAFHAFKKVLADIPTHQRLDIFKALISNNDSSSMVAILLDLVREELRAECRERLSQKKDESLPADKKGQNNFFWSPSVIELVELVLRPPKGGPPSLPEQTDAVLSALNLYRFVFITESTGKTNYSGVLSKNNLQKAYNEWLLPLRTLVTGIVAENKNDHDQLSEDIGCALNPVELVLYRCIELVEDNMNISM